jgi:tRNA(Leu) C34 or U34 (ribose-2'-O)-methylase TrmL
MIKYNDKKINGYACIGLDNPKNNNNIGAVLRACGIYDVLFLAFTGKRYKKSCVDTMAHYQNMPLFHINDLKRMIPYDCVPVAVDIINGATSLHEYIHPQRAFYIFGAEDATLGKRITSWCRDIVYIPTNGCMNLAATVNVVLYDRLSKNIKKNSEKNKKENTT